MIATFFQRYAIARCRVDARHLIINLFVGCWAGAIVTGTAMLWHHASTAGAAAIPQQTWPLQQDLLRSPDAFTLVMTTQPDCPCSRASVDELEILMARCAGKLRAVVLMADPSDKSTPVESTDLWQRASHIQDVQAVADPGAVLIRRFGGKTSGQVFLYDGKGELKFNGGITAARGHEGDNDGINAVDAIVHSRPPAACSTPVFGCRIW